METTPTESRSVAVPVDPVVAGLLQSVDRDIADFEAAIKTLAAVRQKTAALVATRAGQDLQLFESWEVRSGPEGVPVMIFTPPPMPMPVAPTKE